jgi:hypothetical protein
MLLVRDIMHCKPGKARPMVEKFVALANAMKAHGIKPMRILTDLSGDRYWTVISEMEVESMEAWEQMGKETMNKPEFKDVMKGYHDLIDHGRREIYTIEK